MASGKLYTYPDNHRAYKVLIAAQYSGAKVDVVPGFKIGETNKSDDFLAKFPLGKVPAFESTDGVCLYESNAIAHYVGNAALRGSTDLDAAYVQQWINFADNEILPAACAWVFPCLGIMQYNKQNTERAREDLNRALRVLNSHLTTKTYLVGERISQADIAVACNLLLAYKMVFDENFRKPYPNVNRWFTTLVNQPQFKTVIGEVKLCEKMATFDAKKYQELQGQTGQKKKEGKKDQKPKEQKQQPKKEQKPKEQAAEPEEEPKPKPSRDPFANLPAGTFVMDDWKKMYSNNDTLSIAVPWFWENFDAEHYSIWYCEYKYPKDLTLTFMSCNLIGGMFQRLDRMRKHGFASVLLFGEDNNSTISGIWVWRGQGLAFELSEDLQVDYEVYDWKKLDPTTDETKKMVKEYLAWEGDFDGKKLNQGKVFK